MSRPRALRGALFALAIPPLLAACPGPRPGPTAVLDRGQVLDPHREGPDTLRRTMECVKRDANGTCLENKCTSSPEGDQFDCESYAGACIDAGLHWKGTKQSGVCSVPS